jgi:hypothetical protein
MSEITSLQIQGPVVVLPLDEYLEIKSEIENYRRLKTIYDREREVRFRQLFGIAERNQDIPFKQVEADVSATADAIRAE